MTTKGALMPGLVLLTDLDRDRAMALAIQAARALGFEIQVITEHRQFKARRSTLTRSLLLPPFTPYCNFLVTVLEGDAGHEVVLQRNNPWWTGFFGLRAVRAAFDRLLDATEDAVEAAGGTVMGYRHF